MDRLSRCHLQLTPVLQLLLVSQEALKDVMDLLKSLPDSDEIIAEPIHVLVHGADGQVETTVDIPPLVIDQRASMPVPTSWTTAQLLARWLAANRMLDVLFDPSRAHAELLKMCVLAFAGGPLGSA